MTLQSHDIMQTTPTVWPGHMSAAYGTGIHRPRIGRPPLGGLMALCVLCLFLIPGTSDADNCASWCGPSQNEGRQFQLPNMAAVSESVHSSDIPRPQLRAEPEYTRCNCNWIYWEPITDPNVVAVRVECSTDPEFHTLYDTVTLPSSHDSALFPFLPEDTLWYRAFAFDGPTEIWSEPSEAVSSIQDTTLPTTDCDLSVEGPWTTRDTFTIDFEVADAAGIDSVFLYYRSAAAGTWTCFDSMGFHSPPAEYHGSRFFSTVADGDGDAPYGFFVGAKDNAKAATWNASADSSVGNRLDPSGNGGHCAISVDTHAPYATIDSVFGLDTLHATLVIEIPYRAYDSIPDFHSGLDTVYIFWRVDSGAVYPDGPVQPTVFDSVITLSDLGDSSSVEGNYTFVAPFDTSIYYFYAAAVDEAGNHWVDAVIYSTRVFTTLQITLTLFDPVDTDDSSYTATCDVDVRMDLNVLHADSFVLCEDPTFSGCSAVIGPVAGPVSTTYTFSDCSDGEKHLYCSLWVGGGQAQAAAGIIIDTQDPMLESLALWSPSAESYEWTDERVIEAQFSGSDEPMNELQWIVFSEVRDFASADTFSFQGFSQEYLVSPNPERKWVFAKLVDFAEHASNVDSASIRLGERPHNYPNPFNPDQQESTNLVFILPTDGPVTVLIYDLFGNLVFENTVAGVKGLNDGGINSDLRWNGCNMQGEVVASGGYLCVLKAGNHAISDNKIKIAVIK